MHVSNALFVRVAGRLVPPHKRYVDPSFPEVAKVSKAARMCLQQPSRHRWVTMPPTFPASMKPTITLHRSAPESTLITDIPEHLENEVRLLLPSPTKGASHCPTNLCLNCVFLPCRVRERVGRIILHLWRHPLNEARAAILEVVRASIEKSSSIADDGGRGRDGTKNFAGSTGDRVATDFFIGTYDIITYCFEDAMERVKDGAMEEKSNGRRSLRVGHPHWQKYQRDRKQSTGMFQM